MDKVRKDGTLLLERLQFARLRSAAALDDSTRSNLRGTRDKVDPASRMWLGEVSDYGDCFITLTDPYWIPGGYFALSCVASADDADTKPRGTANSNDTRVGKLDDGQVTLLRLKMQAFWSGKYSKSDGAGA